MKLLTELYEDLSFQELSNVAIGQDGSGVIREQDRPKIIGYTNEALLRLCARFVLIENDVLVQLFKHITNYYFLLKYAQSADAPEAEGNPYILDLHGEPFKQDLIKVLKVQNNHGFHYPLNDEENRWSLYTPKFNMLQVPYPEDHLQLSVVYQAKHPNMLRDADPSAQYIFIPDVLYGALRAFIAYKVFSHMNTQESTAKAQEHMQIYEQICLEAQTMDLVNSSISTTNTVFHKRGFV